MPASPPASLSIVEAKTVRLQSRLRRPLTHGVREEGRTRRFSCHNRDVAKARDLEQRIQRLEQQLGVYQKISRLMVRELSLSDTLQAIVNLATEFTACDSCLLYLIDNGEVVLCAASSPHPAQIGRVRLKMDEGLTGWVARERKMLAISAEAYRDPRFKRFSDLPEDNFEAFLSVPVIARNRVIGVVNVQHKMAHRHTGAEMELLTTVGEQVGCLLVLARMAPSAIEEANHVELVMSGDHIARKGEI
jgi:signal transduction protein with GAF and PtsI domain